MKNNLTANNAKNLLCKNMMHATQRWIQDFPEERHQPQRQGANLLFGHFS